jgi:hypothetical protein
VTVAAREFLVAPPPSVCKVFIGVESEQLDELGLVLRDDLHFQIHDVVRVHGTRTVSRVCVCTRARGGFSFKTAPFQLTDTSARALRVRLPTAVRASIAR